MIKFEAKILALLVVAGCIAAVEMGPGLPGGLGDEQPADSEVRAVVEKVIQSIKDQYPESLTRVEPLSYKAQTVAGRNYFVKAIVHESDGDKKVAHLRIYRGFRGNAELTALKPNMKHDDPIGYFS